jgi:hypothetical protein
MATILGREGAVKLAGNLVGEVRSFKLNITSGTADVSVMGTVWQKHRPTQKMWEVDLEYFIDKDDAGQNAGLVVGAEIGVELYHSGETTGNKFWSGTGIIESIDPGQTQDGVAEGSIKIKGSGELTEETVA